MFENRPHWADKAFWWVAPIVILASAAGGVYYYYQSRQDAAQAKSKVRPPAPAAASDESAVRHPVPDDRVGSADAGKPLPPLNESDATVRARLAGLFGEAPVKQMLIPDSIVRRIVVTVDNLPRQKLAVEKRPLKAVAGQTITATEGDVITLSEQNYARYAPLVTLLRAADTRELADLYFQLYPLFQQAYEDLGYPGQYFNDRLVEVIDNLLATPEVQGPITLVQPKVFYEFADRRLESRPAGQKLLLRMGPQNAAAIKAKLRELRDAVTTGRQILPETPNADALTSGGGSPPGGLRHWL